MAREREVEHWAYFPDASQRDAFVTWAVAEGYRVQDKPDGEKYGAHLRHVSPGLEAVTERSVELERKAVELGGEYAGWESKVELALPAHIAERIREFVANTKKEGGNVDNEAARYGGIPLMGTIGTLWLMRPDGSIWDVDDEWGKPLQPLAEEHHVMAIAAGCERHEWLRELLPQRPAEAIDCVACQGRGRIGQGEGFFYCPECSALGWTSGKR